LHQIEITAPSKSGQLNSTRILPGEVFNHSFNTFDSSLPAIARSHCSVRAIPSDEFDALQSENAAVASAIQQLQINSLTAQLQRSLAG
jgi:CRP-like cAMP-binding protein